MRHLKTVVFLLAGSLMLNAQKAETPDQNYDLGAKIGEMTITDGGTVLVTTNDGLAAIKPGQDGLLFNFTDYGKINPETELEIVSGSPYVIVSKAGFGVGLVKKRSIIDYMSGKIIFNAEENGWKSISKTQMLLSQNRLLVTGQRKVGMLFPQALAIYDLALGKELSQYIFKGTKTVMGTPLVLSDGIIIPTTKGLMKVDMNSGRIVWENELKNIGWMVADKTEKDIYAFAQTSNRKNTRIYKIGANGTPSWSEERKVKGSVSNFEILPQGLAVVSDVAPSANKGIGKLAAAKAESRITMFSAANGTDLWEKAPKTKGYVQHFYIMDDGILFGIKEGGINKVAYDGTTLFKKPLKTGENILTMATTPQGLIYITSEDANIVNLNTGDQVWKKPLKFKRANRVTSDYDKKNDKYLIVADEKLFSIDANSGTSELLMEADFDGKEDPTDIEIRDNGILLSSDQNMMLLDWDGKVKWHEYKRAPGKSAFGAALAGAMALASAAASASASYEAGGERNYIGQYTARGDRLNNMAQGMANVSSASVAEMLKRFTATSASQDAQFVLTKLDDGVGLMKLNKDTGSIEKEILLKDKKPDYEVDKFGGYLYYKLNDKTIYAYNLTK
ncbi:PQQ-binding-like beta-propeller repeat protein [Algibacter sp. 2305UL17-15]|uniref:outer membrane protein assembly factor BamB family protein n=1 Tax=Algibacter sp. 2305UL17-15 TaxID=3231268 RepID=UPI003457EE7B